MKFRIKKFDCERSFLIEISQTSKLHHLSPGEFIDAFLMDDQGKRKHIKGMVLADRRSFLFGQKVVRLHQSVFVSEEELYGMTLSNNEGVFRQYFSINGVRPIEPKKKTRSGFLGDFMSPMTGKVLSINVAEGQQVQKGDVLLVIEAMKMENRILSQGCGVVSQLSITHGSSITSGDKILTISEC